MSVDGLVSGMDTTSIINKLMQVEAGPQTALRTKLGAVQTAASAYRTVNTTFLAVTSAADAALAPNLWASTKATSSSSAVAVSASPGALTGSLSFTVQKLASAHAVVNRDTTNWTASTAAYGASSIQVLDKGGNSKGTITIGGTQTIADAAAAINASSYGLTAAVVQISATEVGLHVTSKTTGADSQFSLTGAGSFSVNTQGQNAEIQIGTTNPYTVSSATNTFDAVLPGTTFTVSKADPLTPVTVAVVNDPDSVASKISALVDAVNAAGRTVKSYTSNAQGSTAALKGEYSVSSLGGQLLDAISSAVGGDGSPAKIGFQLTKSGSVTFDKTAFLAALSTSPDLVKRMVSGTPASAGPPPVSAVTGIAARLRDVAVSASDATTGTLVSLANGQDSLVKDIQDRIADWDVRLAARKAALTRQFSAMETALSSLKNQSSWLAGQISSLPRSS